jgi:hypothetical protein
LAPCFNIGFGVGAPVSITADLPGTIQNPDKVARIMSNEINLLVIGIFGIFYLVAWVAAYGHCESGKRLIMFTPIWFFFFSFFNDVGKSWCLRALIVTGIAIAYFLVFLV